MSLTDGLDIDLKNHDSSYVRMDRDYTKIGIGVGLNKTVSRPSWDEYFLKIAETVSSRSTDFESKFGCIFVKNNTILVSGYNGFPSGSNDLLLPNSRDPQKFKYLFTNHAEENAIYQAAKLGIPLEDSILYCTGSPCAICCRRLISIGVTNWVIGTKEYKSSEEDSILKKYWIEKFNVKIKIL